MIERFLFHPPSKKWEAPVFWKENEIYLDINHTRLQGWHIPADDPNAPLIIYYGGNAEDISSNISLFEESFQASLLFMNYRGFGHSKGSPKQRHLFEDALAVFDHFINPTLPKKVFLVGRSIGSSIASYVASHRKVTGLVLITPFDSVASIAKQALPWLPLNSLLRQTFNTVEYLKKVQLNFLVISAQCDEIIPRACSDNLIQEFPSQAKVVEVPLSDHQDILFYQEVFQAINTYIKST